MPYGLAGMVRRSGRADCHRRTPGLSHPDATLSTRSRQPTTSPKASRRLFNGSHLVAALPEDDESLWVPIIRSWALTRGFALQPGTRNRYEIRYTRTQHRPASRQFNDHGRVSGTDRLHPRRLHHRHRRTDRDLPRRAHQSRQIRRGPLRRIVQLLPLRPRCTTSAAGRSVTVDAHHRRRQANKARWARPATQALYRRHRPMAERSIAWLTRNKARRVPYRGVAANHLWLTTRAAAVNLVRLTNLGVTHNNGAFTL